MMYHDIMLLRGKGDTSKTKEMDKMRKELVREVAFGRATARITVEMEETEKRVEGFEGIDLGTEVDTSVKIEIVAPNGKVATEDTVAVATEYNEVFAERFEQGGFDKNGKITMVGKASTAGEEVATEINQTIKKMKAELAQEFEIKPNEQIEAEKEEAETIEIAKEIVKQAEKEGVEKLMTAEQIKKWRKRYNDIQNEGGEGYIPTRISQEQYKKALKILEGGVVK